MFFYTRYPSSQILKTCFHDVQVRKYLQHRASRMLLYFALQMSCRFKVELFRLERILPENMQFQIDCMIYDLKKVKHYVYYNRLNPFKMQLGQYRITSHKQVIFFFLFIDKITNCFVFLNVNPPKKSCQQVLSYKSNWLQNIKFTQQGFCLSHLPFCLFWPQFSRCITSQLIKWFSNFREFYYIQMEKFARHALSDGVTDVRALNVGRESELFRNLNMHYNKASDFQVNWRCTVHV